MPSVIIRPPTDILAQVAKDWKLERSRIAVLLPGFLGQLPEEAAGFPCLADREPIPGARACDVEQAAFLLQELAGVDVVVRDEPARRNGPPRQAQGVARAILVIVWHLPADPAARFRGLGVGYHASRIDTGRKTRSHVRQLEALGYTITLAYAA